MQNLVVAAKPAGHHVQAAWPLRRVCGRHLRVLFLSQPIRLARLHHYHGHMVSDLIVATHWLDHHSRPSALVCASPIPLIAAGMLYLVPFVGAISTAVRLRRISFIIAGSARPDLGDPVRLILSF